MGIKNKIVLMVFLGILHCGSALAYEQCDANAYAAILLENGEVFQNVEITDRKHSTKVESWEECYNFAIKQAKSLPESITLTVSGHNIAGGSVNTESYIFIKWQYNDSYFSDSNGEVTLYTNQFVKKPTRKSLKFFKDGQTFQ